MLLCRRACLPRSSWLRDAGRRGAGGSRSVHRRHRRGRHPLPAQQRRVRQEVPARDDGIGRAPSSTSTATAGRTSVLVNSTNWPGRPAPPSLPALYRNNHNGTFTDITRQAGLAVEMYGLGVAAADFDNDGNVDLYVTGARAEPSVPQPRRRQVRRRHGAGRRRRSRLLDERGVVRLRPRRPARSLRRALRGVVDRDGSVLHARRQAQVVLHAGVVQGPEPDALSQQGRRHVRGRDAQGRAATIRRRRRSASR